MIGCDTGEHADLAMESRGGKHLAMEIRGSSPPRSTICALFSSLRAKLANAYKAGAKGMRLRWSRPATRGKPK